MNQQEKREAAVESAYLQATALEHVLQAAGDAPLNAAMIRQLLQPLLDQLNTATQ